MNSLKCDIHVHLVGFERDQNGCFLRLENLNPRLSKHLISNFGIKQNQLKQPGIDNFISTRLLKHIDESILDHAVLFALDGVYHPNGHILENQTTCLVDNDYVASIAAKSNKTLFGASIHPYRADAIHELERLTKLGACLVKWLPSAQLIDLNHPRCLAFYDALQSLNVPLLCHTGTEHVIPGGKSHMNAPILLKPALERGVKVIAAHCGARLFITEKDFFSQWTDLVSHYPNLYGDISAFGYPLRRWALSKILHDSVLTERIIFGSDYPSLMMPMSFLGMINLSDTLKLGRISNPFDKAVETINAAGVPTSAFNRAYQLLRLE